MRRRRRWFSVVAHGAAWALVLFAVVASADRLPSAAQWLAVVSPTTLLGMGALWLAMALVMLARTLRWRLMLDGHVDASFTQLNAVLGWSFLLMTFTPVRAGDFARAVWLHKAGGSGLHGAGMLVAERITDAFVLLLAATLALHASPFVAPALRSAGLTLAVSAVLAYLLGSACASPVHRVLRTVLERRPDASPAATEVRLSTRMLAAVTRLAGGLATLGRIRTNLRTVLISAVIWSWLIAGYHVYLAAALPGVALSTSTLAIVAVNLTALVWILPGNLGMYEMSAVYVLGLNGVTLAQALPAVLVLHAGILAFVVVYGLVCRAVLRRQGMMRAWEFI